MKQNPDLYFRQIPLGPMANFVYLIGSKKKGECLVVDPAWDVDGLIELAGKNGMKITGQLVTHYHPDHVGGEVFGLHVPGGIGEMIGKTNAPIHVHRAEAEGLKLITGVSDSDLVLHDSNDKIEYGDVTIDLLHTPGHTPGSQCFLLHDRLVSGDTLFINGCGRVDLPGADPMQMYDSLERLSQLGDEVVLYPGHDYGSKPSANIGELRRTNQYLQIRSKQDWIRLMGM